jgi:hypothetical protein
VLLFEAKPHPSFVLIEINGVPKASIIIDLCEDFVVPGWAVFSTAFSIVFGQIDVF